MSQPHVGSYIMILYSQDDNISTHVGSPRSRGSLSLRRPWRRQAAEAELAEVDLTWPPRSTFETTAAAKRPRTCSSRWNQLGPWQNVPAHFSGPSISPASSDSLEPFAETQRRGRAGAGRHGGARPAVHGAGR